MDQFWVNVPPVTKSWSGMKSITAALISLQRIKLVSLVFIPEKAFGKEFWRFFTSFCVSKGISFELMFELFLLRTSSGEVERNFITNETILPEYIIDEFDQNQHDLLNQFMERNKAIDYLYFLIQISLSIILLVTLLYYKLGIIIFNLGDLLCRILTYFDSQNRPNVEIHMFGLFTLRRVYFPWMIALLNIIQSRNIQDDFIKLIIYGDLSFFNNSTVWFFIISTILGHFWWYCRELLLSKVHYDPIDSRRHAKRIALQRFGVYKIDLVRMFLMYLFVPPWYWIILSRIKNRR
ncbi:MAG: derlin [Asgard group archaeon]|nr:derlin [Asgard group archaeon]